MRPPFLFVGKQAGTFLFVYPSTGFMKGRGGTFLDFSPRAALPAQTCAFFVCGKASRCSLFHLFLHSFLGRGAGEPFFGFLAPRCSAKAEARVSGSNPEIALPSALLRSALIRTVPPQFLCSDYFFFLVPLLLRLECFFSGRVSARRARVRTRAHSGACRRSCS